MTASTMCPPLLPSFALAWHGFRMGIAALALTVLAGCFITDSEVVLLDAGNSRIPLAAHGVWSERGKPGSFRVIDSPDGRIGRLYTMRSTPGEPDHQAQSLFLMAPVGRHEYMMVQTSGGASIRKDGTFEGGSELLILIVRIERNVFTLLQPRQNPGDDTQLAALANQRGLLLKGGVIQGSVNLGSFQNFAADALRAGLLEPARDPVLTPHDRQHWHAADWQRFETLRRQLEHATAAQQRDIEEALREPASERTRERLDALVALPDKRRPLMADPEGMLLLTQAWRHMGVAANADALDRLERYNRLQAATYGHVPSQLWVGRHYETRGKQPLDDLNSALRWYELAAATGNAEAAVAMDRVRGRLAGMALK